MFITQLQQLAGRLPTKAHLEEPLSREVDLQGKAWSALDVVALGVLDLRQAAAFYQIDVATLEQYKPQWQALR